MARVATFQSGLWGFKVVYILRAYMSVFDDPASLRGQSFGYALAPLDPLAEDSETFVETARLGLFIDEQGEGHVSGPLRLYAPTDPIDCDEVPTFSKGNLFIRGVYESIYRDVIPTTDGTLDLGSVSRTWNNIYAKGFVFKGAEITDKFTISYKSNFSEVDYGETPFSTAGALVFNDELNGPVIWKVGGTGNGAFIIVNSDNFVSTGNAPSIARFYATAPGAPGPALQLYQGGIEKFQVNDKGADIYGNLTTESVNDGPLAGFRNLAINGNFDIWQRGTTTTGTVGVVGPFRVADRWVSGINPSALSYSPSGSFTVSQRACTSTEFSYFNASFYQRLTHTNVNFGTNLNTLVNDSASSVLAIQGIENAVSVLGKTLTLSFWARASTATKIVSEQQIHSLSAPLWTPTICKTFDLTTTWQKFTHTYTLPTYSQVIAAGYNPSTINAALTNPTYTPMGEAATLPLVDWLFQIDIKTAWSLGEWRRHGNAYSGSRPSGFEGTEQTLAEMQSMNNSFIANGYYDIAQIQLEPGPVDTPFERRPIGTELALCQRYFYKQTFYVPVLPWRGTNADFSGHMLPYPVEMRAAPNLTGDGAILPTRSDTAGALPNANNGSATTTYVQLTFTSFNTKFGLVRNDVSTSTIFSVYGGYIASAEL